MEILRHDGHGHEEGGGGAHVEDLFYKGAVTQGSAVMERKFFGMRDASDLPFVPPGMRWGGMDKPRALARCMFVYPGITSPGWASLRAGASNEATYMSHGMAYVSSALKARGHLSWLLDMRACRSWKHFADRVRQEEYDVAFIGFLSLDVFTAAAAVRVLKEVHPDRPVVVGGLDVSCAESRTFPEDDIPDLYLKQEPPWPLRTFLEERGEAAYDPAKFPKADCVMWNEAEIAACLWVEARKAGDASLPKFVNAGTIPDLNETPHSDRDLFNCEMEAATPLLPFLPPPFFTVTFGRGCPFKCSFCNVGTQLSSSKPRLLSPEYFMDELEQLRARFGKVGSLMIHDDILLYPKWIEEWNLELRRRFGYVPYWCQMRADFIVKFPDLMRLMAECGLAWVSIGLESGSQRILDFMSKQTTVEQNVEACAILEALGVNVFGNWMLGIPTETPDDVEATAKMMLKIRPGFHSASIYCDYRGTSLARFVKKNGLAMPEWYDRSHYPWQRRLKGVDYNLALHTRARVTSEQPNRPQQPKLWQVR